MPSLLIVVPSALTGVLIVPLLAVAGFGGTTGSITCPSPVPTSAPISTPSVAPTATMKTSTPPSSEVDWDAEQYGNAQIIVRTGAEKHVPAWGWVIAVAAAIQESELRDRPASAGSDAVGLFQQRPSPGDDGPGRQVSTDRQAAAFYEALLSVPNWQQVPLAQAVSAALATDSSGGKLDTHAAIQLVTQVATQQRIALPPILQQNTSLLEDCAFDDGDGLTTTGSTALPDDLTLPIGAPSSVAVVIAWGLQQLGTPYSYGGRCTNPHSADPSQQCDCSSLMQMAYRAAGIDIPRTTIAQGRTGTRVTPTQLRPGDLIFIAGSLGTSAQPRHVGLYLGNARILQAPHTGSTVRITPLSQWAPQIAMVRRIVPQP